MVPRTLAAVQPSNSDPHVQPWWRARIASFGFAIKGVKILLITQPHAKIHLLVSIVVIAFGWWLSLSITSWCLIVLAMGGVWATEAINSAIEFLVDLVHPEWHDDAGRIKDLAAGAVLFASVAAAVVGILVFGSRLFDLGLLP